MEGESSNVSMVLVSGGSFFVFTVSFVFSQMEKQ
jgi:hypothetical protein